MSFELRWYQEEAITAALDFFATKAGHPLIVLPTGTGKSLVIAELLRRIFTGYPAMRALMLTDAKELIGQNADELLECWPTAPIGIYSAGLKKREVRPITFAGIATVVKRAQELGHIDLIIIDECHMVSPHDETMYQNFIADLQAINPAIRLLGLTATPYRMGQGLLTNPIQTKKGERPPLFTDICYDVSGVAPFNRLIAEGFLAPLIPKRTTEKFNLAGVGRQNTGEFNLQDLQAAVDREEITRRICDEIIEKSWRIPHSDGRPRLRWLIFSSGVDHAEHICHEMQVRGIDARFVHSKMKGDRGPIVEWFKRPCDGLPRALINNGIFTKGFNCKEVDLIGMARATESASLWVQMLGRGTRPFPGKDNCLVLDFAGNAKRLGPINDPKIPKAKGKGGGDAPIKICEACDTYNHASVRTCICCGAEFPIHTKFTSDASEAELVKESEAPQIEIFEVNLVSYAPHFPRDAAKPPSLKVSYSCGLRQFSEWICLEHSGFAGKKARDWWRQRMGMEAPATVEEAVEKIDELSTPTHIRVWLNQRHPQIMAYDFTGTSFGSQPAKAALPQENLPF